MDATRIALTTPSGLTYAQPTPKTTGHGIAHALTPFLPRDYGSGQRWACLGLALLTLAAALLS